MAEMMVYGLFIIVMVNGTNSVMVNGTNSWIIQVHSQTWKILNLDGANHCQRELQVPSVRAGSEGICLGYFCNVVVHSPVAWWDSLSLLREFCNPRIESVQPSEEEKVLIKTAFRYHGIWWAEEGKGGWYFWQDGQQCKIKQEMPEQKKGKIND